MNYENTLTVCDHLQNINQNLKKKLSEVKDNMENLESVRLELAHVNSKAKEENLSFVNKVKELEAKVREATQKSN